MKLLNKAPNRHVPWGTTDLTTWTETDGQGLGHPHSCIILRAMKSKDESEFKRCIAFIWGRRMSKGRTILAYSYPPPLALWRNPILNPGGDTPSSLLSLPTYNFSLGHKLPRRAGWWAVEWLQQQPVFLHAPSNLFSWWYASGSQGRTNQTKMLSCGLAKLRVLHFRIDWYDKVWHDFVALGLCLLEKLKT